MYKKIGTMFCSNAVLAGVASTFVCAGKDVKDIACKNDLDLETLRSSKVKQEDIEQINKWAVLVYVLISLGVLSLFVGLALIIRLNYLKKEKIKKIKAIDEDWERADFGRKSTSSVIDDFDKKYMGTSFSGNVEHFKNGAGFLFNLLNDGKLVDFEFIFASKAEKVYKKILKNPKLIDKKGKVVITSDIKSVAKEEDWIADILELERFGFFFRCLYFAILNKKNEYEDEFFALQAFLKKIYRLKQKDIICELMGLILTKKGENDFYVAADLSSFGDPEILGNTGYYDMPKVQKMTGGALSEMERYENLLRANKPVTQQ